MKLIQKLGEPENYGSQTQKENAKTQISKVDFCCQSEHMVYPRKMLQRKSVNVEQEQTNSGFDQKT